MMTDEKAQIVQATRSAIPRRGGVNLCRTLDDKVLWQIFLRWKSAHSTRSIATWIHKRHGKGASVESVETTLKRYKKRISHLFLAALPARPSETRLSGPPVITTIRQLEAKGDLEELLTIRDHARQALLRMHEEEALSGITNSKLAQRMNALAALEKAIVKVEEAERKKPPVERRFAKNYTAFEKLISGMPDNGEELVRAGQEFLEAMEEGVQVLEKNEDGTYRVRPRTEAERIRDLSFGICGGLNVRPKKEQEESERDK